MSGQNTRNNDRKAVFTNAYTNSYDSTFSSLSFKYIDDKAFLVFAPIFPNMVGKTPKKGERIYDYDNAISFFVSPQVASTFLRTIRSFMDDQDSEEPSMTKLIIGDEFGRTMTLCAPGAIRISKKVFEENYVLKVTSTQNDETINAYHVLQTNVCTMVNTSKEEEEFLIHSDIELLITFCEELIKIALASPRHIANYARNMIGANNNSNKGNGKRGNAFANMEDDEDDEPTSDDDEEESAPSSKKTSNKKPTKTVSNKTGGAQRKKLAAEFDDEDEGGNEEQFDDDIPM